MAKSIGKKLKGMFMSKNKKKKADIDSVNDSTGSANDNTGFEVLKDVPALDADKNTGALVDLGANTEKTTVEAPAASDEVSEKTEEIEPETGPKAEKTHEKVARIAAEKNTKGYGL